MQTTALAVPERTRSQKLEALERANEVRLYRAQLKRDMAKGCASRTPMDVVADPLPFEETWKVYEVVRLLPTVGRVKAQRLLARHHVSVSKTVGGLSDRQRAELVRALWQLPSVSRGMVRS